MIKRGMVSQDRLRLAIPALFVVFGISILIQIMYVLNENNL